MYSPVHQYHVQIQRDIWFFLDGYIRINDCNATRASEKQGTVWCHCRTIQRIQLPLAEVVII